MPINLTKDADELICVLYKSYLERRKDGLSKSNAKKFGGYAEIQSKLMPKHSAEDVNETCCELSRAKMVDCFFADDVVQHLWLTDASVIYMESRFKDRIDSVLDYLVKIRSIMP